jgi:glutamine synthetase
MKHDLVALRKDLQSREIDVLRFIYSDVLGITRSKDMLVSQIDKSAHSRLFVRVFGLPRPAATFSTQTTLRLTVSKT